MNHADGIKIVNKWFRTYRESYEWPRGSGRQKSEEIINSLCSKVCDAVVGKELDKLHSLLLEIHKWKTGNRKSQTEKYCGALKSKGNIYLEGLIQMAPFNDIQKLENLIIHLKKVNHCNLPVCTAIASFLYGRKKVPIIDRFLSQFFARKFKLNSVDEETKQVVNQVKMINFKFDNNIRLAVYSCKGFKDNLKIYLEEFILECEHIANVLNQSGARYLDLQGNMVEFTPQDVEMAIFSWATKHSGLFS